LDEFKTGKVPVLIATDVAARGLDVPDVEYVINFTFPLTVEDYVHRIGRTGRAGKTGVAHTLFTINEKKLAGSLCNVLRQANQPVPEALAKFGPSACKRPSHPVFGSHFKADDGPMPAAKKITFNYDEE